MIEYLHSPYHCTNEKIGELTMRDYLHSPDHCTNEKNRRFNYERRLP
jgi:hypothetical protein